MADFTANYRPNPKLTIQFTFKDTEEYMTTMHALSEVLSEDTCGKCKKRNILPVVRTVDKYTYRELKCQDCGATLQFGKQQDGSGLYPRRYEMDGKEPKLDKDGKRIYLPNNGWVRWDAKLEKYV